METQSFQQQTGANREQQQQQSRSNGNGHMEEMAQQYSHINGWGIDADPMNEPTYPMKKYNGDDHKRSAYNRPTQQEADVEILHSNERPNLSAVFGNQNPPTAVSGAIRRYAFKYSEESLRHWMLLVLADRVNVLEGVVMDFAKGKIPNVIKERGLQSEWKHNRKGVLKTAIVNVVALGAVLLLMTAKKRQRKFSL